MGVLMIRSKRNFQGADNLCICSVGVVPLIVY